MVKYVRIAKTGVSFTMYPEKILKKIPQKNSSKKSSRKFQKIPKKSKNSKTFPKNPKKFPITIHQKVPKILKISNSLHHN